VGSTGSHTKHLILSLQRKIKLQVFKTVEMNTIPLQFRVRIGTKLSIYNFAILGGLQPQIEAIGRRVLDGRVIRPAKDESASSGHNNFTNNHRSINLPLAALEAKELELLGLTPVRGLLLYGPPGCGK
jgi:hypothetical protein